MNPNNKHKRITLSQNACGQVAYCESCHVIEMALGAVSIRVHADDLAQLAMLLQQADARMEHYHREKAHVEDTMLKASNLH